MFELTESNLKQQVGDIIYRKALDLYLRNKIRQINIIKEPSKLENYGTDLIIDAIVESSIGYNNYEISITINSKEMFIDYKCNCEAFANMRGLCKHITAVLIKFCREKDILLARRGIVNYQNSQNILHLLKANLISFSAQKELLRLCISYNFESTGFRNSWLELKVGKDRLYVVKNINSFFRAIKYKRDLVDFGVNLIFNPLVHSFSNEDMAVINLVMEIFESNEELGNSSFINGNIKFIAGKKVYLTEIQTKRFFDMMIERNFDMFINNECFSDISVKEEKLPINFSMTSQGDKITVQQMTQLPTPITFDKEYWFYDGEIYKIPDDQRNLYVPFYDSFIRTKKNSISFVTTYDKQTVSYIVPSLKSICPSFEINNKLEGKFYEVPLKINAFFDKVDDTITADLQFVYDNITINPFNEKIHDEGSSILIRDFKLESQAVTLLLQSGFEKSTSHFILKDEEALVIFLSERLSEFQKIADVYYSESFKDIKIYPSSSIRSSVRLNDNDLLEFSFNIDGVELSELKNIFDALREKKKYYKLKKGGFIPLDSKEINDIGNLIDFLDIKDSDFDKDSIVVKKYNALYIDQTLKQNNMLYVEKNKKFRELINSVHDIRESDFKVPQHLDSVMRGYQKIGFKWFKTLHSCSFGGILADEMGLGKTLQSIAFIESYIAENPADKKPALVIAPTSLVYNWKSEIEKFSSSLKPLVITGTKLERDALKKEIDGSDVVITSYPLLRRDIDDYKDIFFSLCFIDEAQQIKNPVSQNAQCVKELTADGYFALTGTPIENSLTELWSIFDFIMPGYLLSHSRFLKKYEMPIVKNKDSKALEELNKHIKPFILRRFKKEVVKELPPKIEHKLSVDMTEDQEKLYMAYLASAREEFNNEIKTQGINRNKIKILSLLTRLRQICCDPSIFIENYDGESGKMLALDELLENSINEGHRVLLFSQFTSVLKNIEKRFIKNGLSYMYLDGNTPVKDRLVLVNDFNNGDSSVFLISLKAGGTGLNLTGADVVIHFDPWWNPAVEEQAVDRAHRIGQKKTVEVIKLLSRGTIEEKIYNLQEKKKEIIKNVIDSDVSEDLMISEMSEEEIEDLFK